MEWHIVMGCDEYQRPVEERDAGDLSLLRLAQNNRWRCCQRCRRMIELTQGCFHMTCWCGHEFCYSCGADYAAGVQTCDVCSGMMKPWSPPLLHESKHHLRSGHGTFDCMPTFGGGGGAGRGGDDNPCQSLPRCADSYIVGTMDLHQLPWLERFVSVISDTYDHDYIQ